MRLLRHAQTLLLCCLSVVAIPAAPTPSAAQSLRLARVFSDGVVVQRQSRIPVWGVTTPNADVVVSMRGQTVRTSASGSGAFTAQLASMNAGGPYVLRVSAGRDTIVVNNVLVGDVWLASGQSNMEWKLADANDGAREAANAHDLMIREFKVPNTWSWNRESEVAGGQWASADPQHAGNFSAVAYFFARELRASTGVPIAIINAAWSGSSIAPWSSRETLALDDAAWNAIRNGEMQYQSTMRDTLRARLGGVLPTIDSGLVNGRALWADFAFDDSKWTSIVVPSAWERAGYAGLDGVAWYRTSFTLSDADAKQNVRVAVGAVDDGDITYVNGVEVGKTNAYGVQRLYSVPATALKVGRNTLTVRVTDGGGDGGIIGSASQVYVEVGGEKRPFAARWQFKVATVSLGEDGQHVNKIPTILYNRMIHPLLNFPIKGVIWYQGESNANNDAQASAYRNDFATLIQGWRKDWKSARADFPFLWVQLPNFGTPETDASAQGSWALVRESQSAALSLPNTGQAITIDVGEAANLHPRNKQDVGHRLALIARTVAYGEKVVSSGPTYRAHTVSSDHIDVEFNHVGGGLVSRADSNRVTGFAIAGADGKYVWADARILGHVVRVSASGVSAPQSVRYAWSNSPSRPSLYNREGLPAAPFRTDKP